MPGPDLDLPAGVTPSSLAAAAAAMTAAAASDDPRALFQRRLRGMRKADIAAGDTVLGMLVTPELLADYAGHEVFLKERARHSPHCYRNYDALRLCFVQRLDPDTCGRVVEAYRPCGRELQRLKVERLLALEDERRRLLSAKAKVLAATTSVET